MRSDGDSSGGRSGLLSFVERSDVHGFSIVDHVDRRRCQIETDAAVDPIDCETDGFCFPVDRAVSIAIEAMTVPHTVAIYVRNGEGRVQDTVPNGETRRFPAGQYQIELTTPIKLYVLVRASFEIHATPDSVTIRFDERTRVTLGMRAPHVRPQATITTPGEPAALMQAVSQFGSALDTTSCERSYPSLRGHPPDLQLGEALSIPDGIERPETGVTIRVRPEVSQVFTVSTLAYYLGADVRKGGTARIQTETGFEHRLEGTSRGFVAEVDRVLKQCFFLDCITRTEGLYQFDLHEREQLEERVSLDFADLYDRSLPSQLETYLEVPWDVVEPDVPRWQFTAHLQPDAKYLEALPYVSYDLATVRTKRVPDALGEHSSHTARELGITEFVRRDGSGGASPRSCNADTSVVQIDSSDALADVWFGPGIPTGGSKGLVEAYRNRFGRSPSDGNIDITVVVNDSKMAEEGRAVTDVYGTRENLPFEVTVFRSLTTDAFEQILSTNTDFLHYVGHIDERGFECADGWLDANDLAETGVDSFLLNACESYEQGTALIDAGAIAGVVTSSPVSNEEAKLVGTRMARLLNYGFPFYAAVDVARTSGVVGDYRVIGDVGMNITQAEGGVASLCDIKPLEFGYFIKFLTYLTRKFAIGSVTIPQQFEKKSFLSSGCIFERKYKESDIQTFFSLGDIPVLTEDGLIWSDELLSRIDDVESN